jgi:hypothetical protein
MSKLQFNSERGHTPSYEARRYIYRVLASALENDMTDPAGWILGGVEQEPDRRRLHIQAKRVIEELSRKGRK